MHGEQLGSGGKPLSVCKVFSGGTYRRLDAHGEVLWFQRPNFRPVQEEEEEEGAVGGEEMKEEEEEEEEEGEGQDQEWKEETGHGEI